MPTLANCAEVEGDPSFRRVGFVLATRLSEAMAAILDDARCRSAGDSRRAARPSRAVCWFKRAMSGKGSGVERTRLTYRRVRSFIFARRPGLQLKNLSFDLAQ